MTVNTYWHDNNLDPSDYLTTSDAGTTYVPYTGATGDVDLGTNNLDVKEINQYATSEYEGPTIGPELLDDTGWTSVDWTGSWSTGWQMTGVPATLIRPVTLVAGHKYYLDVTATSTNGTINIGGIPTINHQSSPSKITYLFTAVDSSDFVYYSGSRSGLKFFSLKEQTAPIKTMYSIYDSTGTKTLSIQSSLSSLKNMFIGLGCGGENITGYENIGLGGLSLSTNISGNNNSSMGYSSLLNNTVGNTNVAIGAYSLFTNASGSENIAIGAYSSYLSIESQNIAIGAYSSYNSLGDLNIAIGYRAFYSGVGGLGRVNIAIGGNSLYKNTSGEYNVANGYDSLYNNTTGTNNIGIGYSSLYGNTIGGYNIGIGRTALYNNTTGTNNIGIGYLAGSSYGGAGAQNLNSTYSVFLGESTKAAAANGVNEIVIGYNATGNGSNTVTLGHTTITGTYLRGDIRPVDGKNLILGTTTGMKIGTATNQKIGFFNATPIVQVGATIDLGTVLSNLGLRAAGTAYPITTSGAVSFTGNFTHNTGTATFSNGFTIADARNIVLNTTTGTKIGTSTTQKLGFYNQTPIVQGAGVADATGGAVIDAEARTAINALISRIEALGLIATV